MARSPECKAMTVKSSLITRNRNSIRPSSTKGITSLTRDPITPRSAFKIADAHLASLRNGRARSASSLGSPLGHASLFLFAGRFRLKRVREDAKAGTRSLHLSANLLPCPTGGFEGARMPGEPTRALRVHERTEGPFEF